MQRKHLLKRIHSFYRGERFAFPRDAGAFIGGVQPIPEEAVSGFNAREEYLMLRLRTSEECIVWSKRRIMAFEIRKPRSLRRQAEALHSVSPCGSSARSAAVLRGQRSYADSARGTRPSGLPFSPAGGTRAGYVRPLVLLRPAKRTAGNR